MRQMENKTMKIRIPAVLVVIALTITTASAQYKRTDLVSNGPTVAPFSDPHLVNAWGLVALPTSPWWTSGQWHRRLQPVQRGGSASYRQRRNHEFRDSPACAIQPRGDPRHTDRYRRKHQPHAIDFTVTEDGRSSRSAFIFATLDGTISAWNPTVGLANPATGATHATIAVDRSGAGATYTGLAIATNQAGTFLYAADGGPNRRIDMFDGAFHLVKSFDDPAIPKNFTPYGIQTVNDNIWVTFTALNKAQGGFVDVFDTEGNLVKHFAVHGPLHSPWGIALAPADFGPMSNAILISNNISRGRINAFNPATGQFLGPLRNAKGKPIEVDNIWALQFGQDAANNANGAHNQLFFTAGPNDYANGLFGVITAGP
jgi:uncharacterized protein (TIGR03118 family)